MRHSLLAFALLLSLFSTQAASVLDTLMESFAANTIELKYRISMQSSDANTFAGEMLMQGESFTLTTPDLLIWYNGATLAAYYPDNKEVTLTTPTVEEIAEVNPYYLLKNYRKEYKVKVKEKNNTGTLIELTPISTTSPYTHILLTVNEKKLTVVSLVVHHKNKAVNTITVTHMGSVPFRAATTFEFPKSKYRGVEVVDMRSL